MLKQALLITAFFGYFAFALVVIVLHDRPRVRQSYLAVFFSVMLVPVIIGGGPLPFASWYLFTDTAEQSHTYYEFRVVDADGRELLYDSRAVPPERNPTLRWRAEDMATEYQPAEARDMCRFLLQEARAYRTQVLTTSPPLARTVRFPPHNLDKHWTEAELERTSEFTRIRVYRVHVVSSDDGQRVVSTNERAVIDCTGGVSR